MAVTADPTYANPIGHRVGVGFVGLLGALVAAWGGIVAFAGPAYGFNGPGTTAAWAWNGHHLILNALPAAAGVLGGLLVLLSAPWVFRARAATIAVLSELLMLAAGAWFVLGPLVWPIYRSALTGTSDSPPLRFLQELGYSLGPGILLCILGGLALGLTLAAPSVRARPVGETRPAAPPQEDAEGRRELA